MALSHAGLNRKTRFATLTVVAGANLPDIDIVTWADSTATYLKYHRGLTHSLLGVTILGGLLGLLIHYGGRWKGPNRAGLTANLRWLMLCGLTGTFSHLLLDFTNPYGVRALSPFSDRWYSWDIVFIADPLFWFVLTLGLGLPALLRLVSAEVGASKPEYRRGAVCSLCAILLLWGARDLCHRRAVSLLDSQMYGEENPRHLGVYPSTLNPLTWTGVIETDSAFHVLAVNALDDHINPREALILRKPASTPALEAAMRTRTAAIFLEFAEFPWASVREVEDGFDVSLRDLRFFSLISDRQRFVVDVKLDSDLRVRSESFSFSSPSRREFPQEPAEGEERGASSEAAAAGRAMSRR